MALLHLISWRLLPAPCLSLLREDEEVLELAGVRELLAVAERYHSLRPDRQVGGGRIGLNWCPKLDIPNKIVL